MAEPDSRAHRADENPTSARAKASTAHTPRQCSASKYASMTRSQAQSPSQSAGLKHMEKAPAPPRRLHMHPQVPSVPNHAPKNRPKNSNARNGTFPPSISGKSIETTTPNGRQIGPAPLPERTWCASCSPSPCPFRKYSKGTEEVREAATCLAKRRHFPASPLGRAAAGTRG